MKEDISKVDNETALLDLLRNELQCENNLTVKAAANLYFMWDTPPHKMHRLLLFFFFNQF